MSRKDLMRRLGNVNVFPLFVAMMIGFVVTVVYEFGFNPNALHRNREKQVFSPRYLRQELDEARKDIVALQDALIDKMDLEKELEQLQEDFDTIKAANKALEQFIIEHVFGTQEKVAQ